MAVADAVCRLVPGVLSDPSCYENESHWNGMLEAPQYSRPEVWHDRAVPPILLSGHHANVEKWRRKQGILRTYRRRPDLYGRLDLSSKQDRRLLKELEEETGGEADLTGAFTFGVSCGIVVVIWFLKLHLEMDDMSFKIVVDSCCDLTPQMKKEPCFVRVPMTIQVDGSVFVDDETFDQADLLWAMQQSENAPSTSCPSPQSYLDAYQGGEEDIYVVTLSALLSGSHNCAEQAKALLEEESPERNVHVFNSCSAAGGEVLIALKIRELASTGMPFKRVVVREVEQYIYQLQTLFVLESLENLRKTGG